MKKFTPSIVIWKLKLSYIKDDAIIQNFYFLSRKRAEKFWKKHEFEWKKEYEVILGGEQLWLW